MYNNNVKNASKEKKTTKKTKKEEKNRESSNNFNSIKSNEILIKESSTYFLDLCNKKFEVGQSLLDLPSIIKKVFKRKNTIHFLKKEKAKKNTEIINNIKNVENLKLKEIEKRYSQSQEFYLKNKEKVKIEFKVERTKENIDEAYFILVAIRDNVIQRQFINKRLLFTKDSVLIESLTLKEKMYTDNIEGLKHLGSQLIYIPKDYFIFSTSLYYLLYY